MVQFDFIMIYIIREISVLHKVTRILRGLFRSLIEFYFFKKVFFSPHIMIKSSRFEEDRNRENNTIKDVCNLFTLKKNKKEQIIL